jgi:hypothetical protein
VQDCVDEELREPLRDAAAIAIVALANLVADGRLEVQLPAGLQPEADLIEDGAGGPAIFGDARDGGEAHPGDMSRGLQAGWYCA